MFYVGQKVVCVDGANSNGALRTGETYTVLEKSPCAVCVRVDAWANTRDGGNGWDMVRFRPVVERKTDISIFTAMLNPSKQRVEA